MARIDILRLLRDPAAFSADPARPELWLSALNEVALPAIQAAIVAGRPAHDLRDAQIDAWRAMTSRRLGLILGPPGTGKTFTLSWMALAYLEAHRRAGRPCRILVTAFTRNAAINVLEGVAEKAKQVLGITVPVRFFSDFSESERKHSIECLPLKKFGEGIRADHTVIGCTTWGLYRALEMGWHGGDKGSRVAEIFDLVCIDEASQLPVPQALMGLAGLRVGGRVLIAGDNKQLPPIGGGYEWSVDDRKLGGSIYDFLIKAQIPEQRLSETFRLNEPLSSFPSRNFYGGEYFSAAAVKNQRLALNPGWEQGLEPWERIALSPEFPVTVILYDGPAAGTRNLNEVAIVRRLVDALWRRVTPRGTAAVVRAAEFWAEQVAVVSPHRAQNVAIRESLADSPAGEGCVVETVERIQGRERDAIVASYTVADPEFAHAEAGFLFSPQRFNVSLTRARSKFILVMSRALLDVVPSDDTVFDAARLLREFVYECSEVGSVSLAPRPGQELRATLLVRRFEETSPLPADLLAPLSPAAPASTPPPAITKPLAEILKAVRRIWAEKKASPGTKYFEVADWEIAKRLTRTSVEFAELRALQLNGVITLDSRNRKSGTGSFWVVSLLEPQRFPMSCDMKTVRDEVERVVLDLQGSGRGPLYQRVRDFFAWVDEAERDVLRPLMEQLVGEGRLRFAPSTWGGELVRLEPVLFNQTPPSPPPEALTDDDWAVLNDLEDLEARRLNFGIFEAWSHADEVSSKTNREHHSVAESLRRLDAHGYVMRTQEETPRIRSRMAELARELRYVKQRFKTDDAPERPYLVRSIKIIARNREKPERNRLVVDVFAGLRTATADIQHAGAVLSALEAVLVARWKADAKISGFQQRALDLLIPAWFGLVPLEAAVITADTGAGKTEAACLPLIVGAAVDALAGIRGVRAVLVYPRIRLAANQAQRLTGYLRELSRQPGMPRLTIGLQTGDVPKSWDYARKTAKSLDELDKDKETGFQPVATGRWKFPFFACPACDNPLMLVESGKPEDRLECGSPTCDWSFDGWVGTKNGLDRSPPHIFLPVTESLHQWMQRPSHGALFGDLADVPGAPRPPRAILADEIHLYSLVPGAQVGYALQRLLARMKANGTEAPLAVGMSATLGDPVRVWSELIGRARERVVHIGSTRTEHKSNVRGREYFYFVQPEVESRGHDVAGASTTIQAVMCLAHGMRRRTGKEGGYRGIVFLDSIDKLKRLHGDYRDAEENNRLARLRTLHKGAAPRCEAPNDHCGHDPQVCDRFRDGECWYFAANDAAQWTVRGVYEPGRNLAVCRSPIFSGTKGADEVVRKSDLVFSTSSLEVGFDDPDMMLVYQHYAPMNLASFVQRKGRGGRSMDDRPITGVTLSAYSPRDTWYFHTPERMLDAADFQVPLNTDNYFVRRGQVLSLLLDWAARWLARGGRAQDPNADLEDVFHVADPVIREVFGHRIFEELEARDLRDLWSQVLREAQTDFGLGSLSGEPRDWGAQLPQVPDNLFSPINLPLLRVAYSDERDRPQKREEDVTLAFSECTPGRGTRRWGFELVHWNPYGGQRAPMFTVGNARVKPFKFDERITRPEEAATLLPAEARRLLGDAPHTEFLRPIELPIQSLGRLVDRNWTAYWEYDEAAGCVRRRTEDSKLPTVNHKSMGRLLGTVIAVADLARATRFPVDALAGLTDGTLTAWRCHRSRGRRTGLRVTHAFWGADISLVLETRKGPILERSTQFLRQIFTGIQDPNRPTLYGYGMESEGICLDLDTKQLDRFIDEEFARFPKDTDEGMWLRSQHFRYLLAVGASGAGIDGFRAGHMAELVVSAAALPDLRDRLSRCLSAWSWDLLHNILKEAWDRLLSQSPVLTGARLDRMIDEVKSEVPRFKELLVDAVRASGDELKFKGWLRTTVLHGLAIRLKQLFVLHGRGDERKVLLHAKLPVQFHADLHDRVTVCEKGGFGDGTTRTFLGRAGEAFEEWRAGGLVYCPNNRADQAIAKAYARASADGGWRTGRNPMDPKHLESLGRELGLHPQTDASALQLVVRLLYGQEEIFGEPFAYFDLYGEIQAVRAALRDPKGAVKMLREPGTWELVGAVVHAAVNGSPSTPLWTRLLEVYGGLEDASLEESLAPQARLADQIYRISARLCADGCQACLHVGSDLMDDDLAATTVSRRVLEHFWHFVGGTSKVVTSNKDDHLFPAAWAHVVADLRQVHGLPIKPGGDVVGAGGRVAGTTIASISLGERRLHLVDVRAPWASATAAAICAAGDLVVVLDPAQGSDPVVDAMER